MGVENGVDEIIDDEAIILRGECDIRLLGVGEEWTLQGLAKALLLDGEFGGIEIIEIFESGVVDPEVVDAEFVEAGDGAGVEFETGGEEGLVGLAGVEDGSCEDHSRPRLPDDYPQHLDLLGFLCEPGIKSGGLLPKENLRLR